MSQPRPSVSQKEMLALARELGYEPNRFTGHNGIIVVHPKTGARVILACTPRRAAHRSTIHQLKRGAGASPTGVA